MTTPSRKNPSRKNRETRRTWSGRVTETSHALELEEGVFAWRDPKRIARSLQ